MSLYCAEGSATTELSTREIRGALHRAFDSLGRRTKVLVVPPDFTRYHSRAGELTCIASEYYGARMARVLPALGTHAPMSREQMETMFPGIPLDRFAVHNWRSDLDTLGEIPSDYIREQSENRLDFAWPVQVNRLLTGGEFDLILSIGQVVPHEVAGMAGHHKNIFIGTGGAENINKSHYLGAVYGMERLMGRPENPVRRVLNYAASHFGARLPILHVLTVIGKNSSGRLVTRGLFIGDDLECFTRAAELSLKVNFLLLNQPMEKAVVYLNPGEFQSTWLGNKAIYRTRMAIADGGTLIVLAPGVKQFGEDPQIDALIRKYGYRGTPATLDAVARNVDLASNLSAAAHLIHGSSEGRFHIVYCPGGLTRAEVEGVGFEYAPLADMMARYCDPQPHDGFQTRRGEDFFYISNPGLGLWTHRDRFF